jgi:hypothetical protein
MADNATLAPVTPPIYCKHCARRLATISPDGTVHTASHASSGSQDPDPSPGEANAHACTAAPTCACAPFDSLYVALQDAEREHQGLLDKKPNHGGRARAHGRLRAAKIAFGNLVLEVQMQGTGTLDAASHRDGETRLESLGRTISMDLGDAASEAGEGSMAGEGLNRSSLGQGQMTQPVPRHSASTWRSRKRIQFTADVPDRDDYRGSDEYCRTHNDYAPGRYTPSDGCEYLDTSGSNQTFLRFTGQRRVRDRWVDVETQEGVENEDGVVVKTGPSKRKKRPGTEIESSKEAIQEDTASNDTSVSSRELRMARRARERDLDAGAGDASVPRKRSRSRKNSNDSSVVIPDSDAHVIARVDAGLEVASMKAIESAASTFQQGPERIFTVQITGSGVGEMFNELGDTESADRFEGKEAQVDHIVPHDMSTTPGKTVDDQQNISAAGTHTHTARRSDDGCPEGRNGNAIAGTLQHSVSGVVLEKLPSTMSSVASIAQQIPHRSQDILVTAPLLTPTTPQQHTIPAPSMDPDNLSYQALHSVTAAQDPGALHCNPTA